MGQEARAEADAQGVPCEHEEELHSAVTKHWGRLPREVLEFPSLETFQNHLDSVLYHVLWDVPAQAGRLDQVISCGPFQPAPSCDSVTAFGRFRATLKLKKIPPELRLSCVRKDILELFNVALAACTGILASLQFS